MERRRACSPLPELEHRGDQSVACQMQNRVAFIDPSQDVKIDLATTVDEATEGTYISMCSQRPVSHS